MRQARISLQSDRIEQAVYWVGLTAVLCLAGSFLVQSLALAAGLRSAAWLGLGLLAVLIGVWRFASWRAAAQRRAAVAAIAPDQRIAFVSGRDRRIAGANGAAHYAFSIPNEATLDSVFADTLADPSVVFDGLMSRAASRNGEACASAVVEVAGYSIRLDVAGPQCLIWSCSRIRGDIPEMPPATVPGFTLDPTGAVPHATPALVSLLGCEPAHVDDILEGALRDIGTPHAVRTAAGIRDYMVSELPFDGNGTRAFVLTVPPADSRPPREAEWDAIEDLPVPLLKVTDDGRLVASNREARKLLHIGSTEGRKLSDVLDGPGRPINDWLAQALGGQGTQVSEFLRGRADNDGTFVQVTLSTAGAGDARHLIAVLNDVTELKTLEAQFVQSQKMQAIGQLAGGIAHDFNNLLTAISGHCDLLLLRHDEGHQNYADLIQIHQNANRAASVVGQLLAFSRKQNLQLEAIDLRATLADLTHLLNRLVGEKVTLSLEHEADLGPIRADRRQLEQVLMNLVVNARDAMQGAGEIRVVTNNMTLASQMRKDRVTVPPGDYVVVNVIDTGNGIAPEKLPKIFEPFYTTKRTGEGTGLGLSMVYGIVKQTGGYVFVESEIGKGTTFSLLFPRSKISPTEARPATKAPAPPDIGGRADGVVLLVEDEAPVRAFASRALRLKGYTVLEADSAEAALEMLDTDDLHVDIFVTDVIMPGMDGPTWVRKALKARPRTKVVFVSGYPEDAFDDGEEPIANAVFLPKPFSLTSLTQTVQTQMGNALEDA